MTSLAPRRLGAIVGIISAHCLMGAVLSFRFFLCISVSFLFCDFRNSAYSLCATAEKVGAVIHAGYILVAGGMDRLVAWLCNPLESIAELSRYRLSEPLGQRALYPLHYHRRRNQRKMSAVRLVKRLSDRTFKGRCSPSTCKEK
jgi:hypothetical protein